MFTIPLCIVFFLGIFSKGGDGLWCYKCVSLNCDYDDPECKGIQSFLQNELRNLYYFKNLPFCPRLNETEKWRRLQTEDEPCGEEKANEATCTLGHLQIKSMETSEFSVSEERVNYATVMGCAKRNLLTRIKLAADNGTCDLLHQNSSTSAKVFRDLQIEHCPELSSMCNQKDYCVNFTSSVVKPWGDTEDDIYKLWWNIIVGFFLENQTYILLGIMGLVGLYIILRLIACLLCRDPPRISAVSEDKNLPDTELEVASLRRINEMLIRRLTSEPLQPPIILESSSGRHRVRRPSDNYYEDRHRDNYYEDRNRDNYYEDNTPQIYSTYTHRVQHPRHPPPPPPRVSRLAPPPPPPQHRAITPMQTSWST